MKAVTPRSDPAPRLLLLMPSTSYRAKDFMEAARRLGVEVTVGSNHEQVLARLAPGSSLSLDFEPLERAVEQIAEQAARHPFTAIVGTDDETSLLAAAASQRLNLAHNTPESVRVAHDKYRFRCALEAAGLPNPWFRKISLQGDLARAAHDARYPCVLKPLNLSGSRGVIRANDEGQFIAACHRIELILANARSETVVASADAVLVESFIPGREVALEGLLHRGHLDVLALFDKPDPLDGPFFEESIYVTPSRLARGIQDDIAAMTARAAQALGLKEGPIHAELRIDEPGARRPATLAAGKSDPWLIELAARTIGGLCSRALSFTQGASLEDLVLRQALGSPMQRPGREQRAAGVMMIPIPRAGRLGAVSGIDDARAVSGIEDVIISIPVGEPVVPLPEGDRYLGFVFARAKTPAGVETALRTAHRCLGIEVAPAPGLRWGAGSGPTVSRTPQVLDF